jgi:hypothetical protein
MSSAGTTISLRAQQDQVMFSDVPTATLFGRGQSDVYTDFGYLVTEIPADGHSGKHKDNMDLKFDPTGLGDSMGSLYLHTSLPALSPSGSASTAYYCQNAGYAQISSLKLKNGNSPLLEQTGRELFHVYQTRTEYAKDAIDPNIFRYKTEAQLQTQSSCNSLMHTPILFSCTRPDRPDNSFPLTTFYHSTIRLYLRMETILHFTVNDGDASRVPYLYGTTTPVTSDSINVRMYATFHLLDDSERLALANSNYFRLWYKLMTHEQESSEAMGKTISVTAATFNGPTRAFFLMFLPAQYTSGLNRSPNGVGKKNYFDYSAPHGGESLYEIQIKINNSDILDNTIPSTLRREQLWRESFSGRPTYSNVYIAPFQPKLDMDDVIHTINPTAVDKFHFYAKKNIDEPGTLFVVQDAVTLVIAEDGVGGVPYQ